MNEVAPNIQKTSELVQEISASSIEQSSRADQINKAIQNLNRVVPENASTAQEKAFVLEQLKLKAEELQNAVSFFKINENEVKSKKNKVIKNIYASLEN